MYGLGVGTEIAIFIATLRSSESLENILHEFLWGLAICGFETRDSYHSVSL